jgi:hypothetical protein
VAVDKMQGACVIVNKFFFKVADFAAGGAVMLDGPVMAELPVLNAFAALLPAGDAFLSELEYYGFVRDDVF